MKPYYEKGGITIYHGDCREVLPALGSFDLLLTDPPYGVTQQPWDTVESVCQVVRQAKLAVFTVGERLLAELIGAMPERYRHIWVWDRVNRLTDFLNAGRRPMRAHELIAVFSEAAKYSFSPVKRSGSYVNRTTKDSTGNGSFGTFRARAGNVGREVVGLHPRSIIEIPAGKTNTQLHPTEKPVALYDYLLRTYPADLTVDTGSLKACFSSRRA